MILVGFTHSKSSPNSFTHLSGIKRVEKNRVILDIDLSVTKLGLLSKRCNSIIVSPDFFTLEHRTFSKVYIFI